MSIDRVEHKVTGVSEHAHLAHAVGEINQQRQFDQAQKTVRNSDGQQNFDRQNPQQTGTIELTDAFKNAPSSKNQSGFPGRDRGPNPSTGPDVPPSGSDVTQPNSSPSATPRPADSGVTPPGTKPNNTDAPASQTLTDPNKGSSWNIRSNWGMRNANGQEFRPNESGAADAISDDNVPQS